MRKMARRDSWRNPAVITVLFVVFSMLCACQLGWAQEQKKVITVEMSVYVEAPHKKAFDLLKEAYEKANPDIEIVYYGPPYAEFWNKLTTEIIGGSEADIVQLQDGSARYARYAALRPGPTGAFLDLEPFMEGKGFEDTLVGQKGLTYNGKYIGLANYAWGTRGVYYRKSHFNEAGIDPDSILTNEDFLDAAIKLTRSAEGGKPARYGFGAVLSTHPFVFDEWMTFLANPPGGGLYFPNEEEPYVQERLIVNSDPIVWAADWWREMIFKHKVVPPGSYDKASTRDLFWNGTVSMNIDGPWFTGMTREYDPALLEDVDVFATPDVLYEGERYRSYGNQYAITHLISSKTKYPQECWDFLEWMTTTEAQRIISVCGMIPSSIEYAGSEEYRQQEPINAKFLTFLRDRYGPEMQPPNIPELGEMEQIMIEAAQEMFITNKDSRTVLDRAATRMKRVLSK